MHHLHDMLGKLNFECFMYDGITIVWEKNRQTTKKLNSNERRMSYGEYLKHLHEWL